MSPWLHHCLPSIGMFIQPWRENDSPYAKVTKKKRKRKRKGIQKSLFQYNRGTIIKQCYLESSLMPAPRALSSQELKQMTRQFGNSPIENIAHFNVCHWILYKEIDRQLISKDSLPAVLYKLRWWAYNVIYKLAINYYIPLHLKIENWTRSCKLLSRLWH